MATLTDRLQQRMGAFKSNLNSSFNVLSEADGRSEFLKAFCNYRKTSDRKGMFEWFRDNYDINVVLDEHDAPLKKVADKISYIFNPLNVSVQSEKSFELVEGHFEDVNFVRFEKLFRNPQEDK